MKYLLFLLLGAVCIQEHSAFFGIGKPWPRTSLKAKYDPLLWNGYYDLPKSTNDKLLDGYVKVDEETADLSIPADLYCRYNDSRVCLIFDKKGTVVGIRISFLKQDVKDVQDYDFSAVDTYKETNVFGQPAFALDVYFNPPDTITKDGVEKTDEIQGVWVNLKGKIVEMPLTDPKVDVYNDLQRQNCFPQMGQHYFFQMNKTMTDCTQHVPFFAIYHNGGLAGFGVANYGKASIATNKGRDWYETVPLIGAKLIMPNRPQCVDDHINAYGLYSLHIYFVDTPYLIGCLFQ